MVIVEIGKNLFSFDHYGTCNISKELTQYAHSCDVEQETKKCKDKKEHDWVNMAPNRHSTCSKCGKVKW